MKKVLVFSESSAAAEKIGELLRAEDGYDLRAVSDLRAARAYNGGEFFCTARRREDDQLSL